MYEYSIKTPQQSKENHASFLMNVMMTTVKLDRSQPKTLLMFTQLYWVYKAISDYARNNQELFFPSFRSELECKFEVCGLLAN